MSSSRLDTTAASAVAHRDPLCRACLHPHGAHVAAGGTCASTPCTCRVYVPYPAEVLPWESDAQRAAPPAVIVPPAPFAPDDNPPAKKKPANLSRLAERHLRAADAVERLERKLGRTLTALVAARKDDRRIRDLEEEATAELSASSEET